MRKIKPTIIIFEGIDKTGKTTLRDEFNKRTKFKYVVLDRFTNSSVVYNTVFKRPIENLKYYYDIESSMTETFNVIVIYCVANEEDISRRLEAANERLPNEFANANVRELFDHVIELINFYSNVKTINTSENSVEECMEMILKYVKEKEEYFDECS